MACSFFRHMLPRRWRGTVASTVPSLPHQASTSAFASASSAQNTYLDAQDSLRLLNNLAQQGSYSLLVANCPTSLNLKALTFDYSSCHGFIGVHEIANTHGTLDVSINFATASDAAMALVNHPSVVVENRTYTPSNTHDIPAPLEESRPRKKLKQTSATSDEAPKCKICHDKLEKSYSIPCLRCKSPWCYDCLQQWFTSSLSDHETFPARCCDTVIHYDTVNGVLPTSEFETYKCRYEEFSTPKPIYCANPTCSAFLTPRIVHPDAKQQLTCHMCQTKTCSKCRERVDEVMEHPCPTANTDDDMLGKYGYKRCPRCNAGVAHMYGCPHVRCQCGAHWCWDCQRPIHICWRNPCDHARADGNEFDDDMTTDEAEDDVRTDDGEHDADNEMPEETILEEVSSHTGQANIFEEAMPHPEQTAPINAEGIMQPAPVEIIPQTEATAPEVANDQDLINLDAPDFDDWEQSNYDFGEEPQDEAWDVWGCTHRIQPLLKIPKFWLPERGKHADCLKCFTPIFVGPAPSPSSNKEDPDDAVLRGRTRTAHPEVNSTAADQAADECDSLTPTIVADNDERQQQTQQQQQAPGKKSAEKAKIFNCSKCGVVYCHKCMKTVTKAMNASLKKRTAAS